MTKSYKNMESRLQKNIDNLKLEVDSQEGTMKSMSEEIEGLNLLKKEKNEANEKEIKELNRRIEEMSSEFADMLKKTLS